MVPLRSLKKRADQKEERLDGDGNGDGSGDDDGDGVVEGEDEDEDEDRVGVGVGVEVGVKVEVEGDGDGDGDGDGGDGDGWMDGWMEEWNVAGRDGRLREDINLVVIGRTRTNRTPFIYFSFRADLTSLLTSPHFTSKHHIFHLN
ncbi:hypothetical protein TWF506_007077 [Arthrobotrys conoides]|uniref:Uncharacterized protein n=1 Tax=Arthrobotrys conoides TaxID=74498 RepID=A0AAN8RPF7_9PEZI